MDMLLKEENYFNEKIKKDLYVNNQIIIKNNQVSDKFEKKFENDININIDGNIK